MTYRCTTPGTRVHPDMALAKEEFGRRLRAARERAHLTQQDLADATGTDWRQIQRYDSGKVLPRADRIPALAAALGVEPTYLQEPVDEHVLDRTARLAEENAVSIRTALGLLDELLATLRDHDRKVVDLVEERSASLTGRIEELEHRQNQFSDAQREILRLAGVTPPPPATDAPESTRTPQPKKTPGSSPASR